MVGGAIFCLESIESINADAKFERNTSNNAGGAIGCEGSIGSVLGTFNNNTADFAGGAIYCGGPEGGNIIESISGTFNQNKSRSLGGAIYCVENIKSVSGEFKDNEATNGTDGYGGIFIVRKIDQYQGIYK